MRFHRSRARRGAAAARPARVHVGRRAGAVGGAGTRASPPWRGPVSATLARVLSSKNNNNKKPHQILPGLGFRGRGPAPPEGGERGELPAPAACPGGGRCAAVGVTVTRLALGASARWKRA